MSYTLRSKKLLKCSLIVIGVRLTEMQVYFTINVGRKFWDQSGTQAPVHIIGDVRFGVRLICNAGTEVSL